MRDAQNNVSVEADMEKDTISRSAIHQFVDDNNDIFNSDGEIYNIGKRLLSYINEIPKNESLLCGKDHIKIDKKGTKDAAKEIVVDEKRFKITQHGFQAFRRFYDNPQPYVDYYDCKSHDAQFRSILPELFVCWYLDKQNDYNYNWSIFDGETDYSNCVDIIKNSYPTTKNHSSTGKVQNQTDNTKVRISEIPSRHIAAYIIYGNILDNAYDKFNNDNDETYKIKHFIDHIIRHFPSIFVDSNCIKTEESVDEQQRYFLRVAEDILNAVNQQPLMAYLFNKSTAYLDEYRNLIYSITQYDNGEIVITPPVETLYDILKQQINQLVFGKCFSAHDLLCAIGKWAESASNNKEGYYYITDISSEIEGISIIDIHKEASKKARKLFEFNNGKYKFALKQYRLIFQAMKLAENYNESLINNPSEIDHIIDDITNKIITYTSEANEKDHTVWAFDDLIDFSETLRMDLDGLLVHGVTNELIECANDFSVSNREYQEKAIAVLSYMLCENRFLKTDDIKRVFEATYGKSIYKFQIDAWPHLQRTTKIFTEQLKNACSNACKIESINNKNYSCADPYYVFLYGALFDEKIKLGDCTIDSSENFLQYCCVLQSNTWREILSNVNTNEENVIKALASPLKYLIKYSDYERQSTMITMNTPYLVYGCNMFFYTVFDCIRHGTLDIKDLFNEVRSDNNFGTLTAEDVCSNFCQVILFNDYMTRKLSKPYNEVFCSSQSTMKGNPNNSSLMLLCGSFRLTSLPALLNLFSKEHRYDIAKNEEMKEQYATYLNYEEGRFKILLIRLLLLCSNYFDDQEDLFDDQEDLPITSQDLEGDATKLFLEYDCISVQDITSMRYILSTEEDKKIRKERLTKILLKLN